MPKWICPNRGALPTERYAEAPPSLDGSFDFKRAERPTIAPTHGEIDIGWRVGDEGRYLMRVGDQPGQERVQESGGGIGIAKQAVETLGQGREGIGL